MTKFCRYQFLLDLDNVANWWCRYGIIDGVCNRCAFTAARPCFCARLVGQPLTAITVDELKRLHPDAFEKELWPYDVSHEVYNGCLIIECDDHAKHWYDVLEIKTTPDMKDNDSGILFVQLEEFATREDAHRYCDERNS